MKKLILLGWGCVGINLVQAQLTVKKEPPRIPAIAHEMEPAAPANNNMSSFRDIPIKAVRSFKSSYQHIDNESWYRVPDGFRARFTENNVLHLVTYNKKGNWLNTMRQYDESKLDKEVRAQVKSVYYDYNIILVEEIEQAMKPLAYVIHMEDRQRFKNIRFCNRQMEEMIEIYKL